MWYFRIRNEFYWQYVDSFYEKYLLKFYRYNDIEFHYVKIIHKSCVCTMHSEIKKWSNPRKNFRIQTFIPSKMWCFFSICDIGFFFFFSNNSYTETILSVIIFSLKQSSHFLHMLQVTCDSTKHCPFSLKMLLEMIWASNSII